MDLQTAVTVSMLPVSRSRASAVFKEVRLESAAHAFDAVLDACDVPRVQRPEALKAAIARTDVALRSAREARIEAIAWFDDRYPALLACISDPPPVLWIRGDAAALAKPTVAVVGSRAATAYALEMARGLAGDLASRSIVVASGLARGVDSAAHQGCLDARGQTIAVLGSGVDRVYPAEHRRLAASICGSGTLIAELGPGAAPLPEHFPLRNRIISGISLAVVVVEASERSGSLITARLALDQGRDVMAVPGNALTGRNTGSHALLKDGAKVVETADDILDELGWPDATRTNSRSKSLDSDPLLSKMQPGEVYRLDDLMALTGMAGPKLLPRLLELELSGGVVADSTGAFSRKSGRAPRAI